MPDKRGQDKQGGHRSPTGASQASPSPAQANSSMVNETETRNRTDKLQAEHLQSRRASRPKLRLTFNSLISAILLKQRLGRRSRRYEAMSQGNNINVRTLQLPRDESCIARTPQSPRQAFLRVLLRVHRQASQHSRATQMFRPFRTRVRMLLLSRHPQVFLPHLPIPSLSIQLTHILRSGMPIFLEYWSVRPCSSTSGSD